MRRLPIAAAGLWLGLWAASLPAGEGPAWERFASASLENGASVGFVLMRTGGAPTGGTIDEFALPRSNSVNRVLVDRDRGTFYGYRLDVDRSGGGKEFRVSVKALSSSVEQDLRRLQGCSKCPPLKLLERSAPYPAPRTLADGDLLTLDLLFNATTGDKIVDVVKVSSRAIAADAMAKVAERLTEAFDAVQRADTFAVRQDYQAAAAEYRRALSLHPGDPVIHNRLGMCLQRAKRTGEAEKEYQEALRLNPNYAEAWNNLGTVQHARNKYKDAIKSYRKAVSLRPSLAQAHKNMGVAYFALGRYDAGFEAFQSAYSLDPNVLSSAGYSVPGAGPAVQFFYFAKLCAAAGQVDQALDWLRKAVEAGFKDFSKVESDPDFKIVVQDPRYKQLKREHR
jgi:Tfp pilus assembly protein PilF